MYGMGLTSRDLKMKMAAVLNKSAAVSNKPIKFWGTQFKVWTILLDIIAFILLLPMYTAVCGFTYSQRAFNSVKLTHIL